VIVDQLLLETVDDRQRDVRAIELVKHHLGLDTAADS
jgi:hypothetical protein